MALLHAQHEVHTSALLSGGPVPGPPRWTGRPPGCPSLPARLHALLGVLPSPASPLPAGASACRQQHVWHDHRVNVIYKASTRCLGMSINAPAEQHISCARMFHRNGLYAISGAPPGAAWPHLDGAFACRAQVLFHERAGLHACVVEVE